MAHTPATIQRVLDKVPADMLMFSVNPGHDYQKGEYAKGSVVERSAIYRRCEAEGLGISVMKPFSGGQTLDASTSPFGKALTQYQCTVCAGSSRCADGTARSQQRKLDAQLCTRKTFRLIKQQPDILAEAQELLSDVEELKTHDFTLTEEDYAILNQINTYEDYLQNPDAYGGETIWETRSLNTGEVFEHHIPQPPIPSPPPAKTKNLLIVPGDTGLKLLVYQRLCKGYRNILEDIASFNMTIHNFINGFLSPLIQLNPSNYAASLYNFFNHPRAERLIANPASRTGLFTNADAVTMRFLPRERKPGEFQIFEYYEAENLQTLLKIDFYRALGAGHIIRRCEYCKQYFLLTKGYHTKYCDLPNPENPSFTCRQLGYRKTGRKEEAKDDPMKQSLFRCHQRLNQDVTRGNLTDKQRQILYRKAEELHFEARLNPGISNVDFEKSLETKNLCKLCGVERKTSKVGRPRKTKAI